MKVGKAFRPDVAQDEILVLVRSPIAAGVFAHDPAQFPELEDTNVAYRYRDRDGDEAILLLVADVRPAPALEAAYGHFAAGRDRLARAFFGKLGEAGHVVGRFRRPGLGQLLV